MKNKLIIFDVCHTLVNTDSTRFYIDFLKSKGYGRSCLGRLLSNKLFFLFSTIIKKILGYNLHRKLTFRFFRGMNFGNLNELNKSFLEKYIKYSKPLIEKLKQYKDDGEKVILLSASVNLPIEILGKYLGIDTYSSELIIKNGIYTGRSNKDLLGKKEYIFKKGSLNLKDFSETILYTDNLDDIGLIKYIYLHTKEQKTFIILNNYNQKTKWEKILSNNNISNYEFIY